MLTPISDIESLLNLLSPKERKRIEKQAANSFADSIKTGHNVSYETHLEACLTAHIKKTQDQITRELEKMRGIRQ